MANRVDLKIDGVNFHVVTDTDEGRLQEVALAVRERVQAVQKRAKRPLSTSQLLLAAALDLADETLRLRESLHRLEGDAKETVTKALALIDNSLAKTSSR